MLLSVLLVIDLDSTMGDDALTVCMRCTSATSLDTRRNWGSGSDRHRMLLKEMCRPGSRAFLALDDSRGSPPFAVLLLLEVPNADAGD